MVDSGLTHRVSDDFAERQRLVADAILLERAAQVLMRRYLSDVPAYASELQMLAHVWRRQAEESRT
jgi:hypothetical protein